MQTVTVVPILRVRRATAGWSYKSPQAVQPGSLVIVPFRGRATLGVVWDTEENTKATETVTEVLTTTPLVRAPHRLLISWLAEAGVCSLSTALYVWMPAALRGFPLTKPVREVLSHWDATQPSAKDMALAKQHAVLIPSRRESAEYQLAQKYGEAFHSSFDDATPAQEFASWVAIATGKQTVVTGRERVLYAPWINLRHVTVIEPEDISFHTGQTPYINLVDGARVAAEAAGAVYTCRTNVPLEAAQHIWPAASGLPQHPGPVELNDLRHGPILGNNLVEAIQKAVTDKKAVILLYNAHDRLQPLEDGTKRVIPGIETLSKQLAAHFGGTLPPLIRLGTRTILHNIPRSVGLCAVLSLDPLLGQSSFADRVHGWGDLGRLQQTGAPLIVQTWNPQHPLVQALLTNTFPAYCMREVAEATAAGLPPFSEEIVCALPTDREGKPTPEELTTQLQQVSSPWQVSFPRPANRRGKSHTVVTLHAPRHTRLPQTLRRILAALPRPWKVERGPWYAL